MTNVIHSILFCCITTETKIMIIMSTLLLINVFCVHKCVLCSYIYISLVRSGTFDGVINIIKLVYIKI